MGRQRQSTLADLIEITSLLPWWAGILCAVISYLLFGFLVDHAGNSLWRFVLLLFQYLFAAGFTIGAALSAFNQWKRDEIFEKQTGINSIRKLSWYHFELLISEAFRRQGYTVKETDYGPDGGVDLILKKDNKTLFVQCKHWQARNVNVKPVRELQGVISVKGADGGIFVTSGQFTPDAIKFAGECHIQLIDGAKLNEMFSGLSIEDSDATVRSERPACPVCGSRMTKRTAIKGTNAGKQFWGCITYPKCRGTISIES